MATIVYLDVDDEITSAAARLRSATHADVALVLPYGSRLSTSRMNFRLLAREAAQHGRRIAVVAPDAGTRALAASAGLAAFASVAEYEHAGENEETGGRGGGGSSTDADGQATVAARPVASDAQAATLVMPPPPAAAAAAHPAAAAARPAADVRIAPSRRRGIRLRGGVIALAGLLALVVLVGGVAAYLYLPTATITIQPRVETIRLPPFTVTADPNVTEVDPDSAVIPATRIEIPVSAAVEQAATGQRVEETRATGSIRFESINTVGPVAVPEGTRVSTLGGIVFVTAEAVTVPAAQVAGSTIERGVATARIRARLGGPEGNVEAGDITQVPDFLRTQQVAAINPAATSGGTREVFQQVQQADVDAAVEALRAQLAREFEAALGDPPGVPDGATTFPDAAVLGEPVITPDPATLVGQEVASFTLEATASGTVLAVDEAPLTGIVESRIASQVSPDRELVPGSIEPQVGEGVVAEGVVRFTLSATAAEVALLDPAEIEARVLGRPLAEVERDLAGLGAVQVEAWPDFVTTVPTLDERVEVIIADPGEEAPDAPEPVPSG